MVLLKTRILVRGQGMQKFQPQEYIEVFRGLKFEHNADIGQKGNF